MCEVVKESEVILSLDSPEDEYAAWAIIFFCFEDRLWKLRNEFYRWLRCNQGAEHFDPVTIAGGPMALAEDNPVLKEVALDQIRISKKAHRTGRVILVFHTNCGAYADAGKVFTDGDEEYRHHHAAALRAEATVKERFPEMEVERYIADFHAIRRLR